MKNQDKNQIQHHVDEGRHHHGVQRRFPISQRTQNRRQNIIRHDNRDSRKHDTQIDQRISDDFIRGLQKLQNGSCHRLADHQKEDRGKCGQQNGICHRLSQLIIGTCPEFMGHPDGKTLRKALDRTQNHPVQPVCRSQCGKRSHPERLSHNHGVNYRIKLLKYVSQHQGHGKYHDQLQWLSLRHVQCPRSHFDFPLCFLRTVLFAAPLPLPFFSDQPQQLQILRCNHRMSLFGGMHTIR